MASKMPDSPPPGAAVAAALKLWRQLTTSAPALTRLLGACLLGSIAVAGGAAALDAAVPAPPFTADGERFDTSSFIGRFAKMLCSCDPATLLVSSATVRRKTKPGSVCDWSAKRLQDTAVNSVTGKLIPRPFRMSGYVPFVSWPEPRCR